MALNSWSSYLHSLTARITGKPPHSVYAMLEIKPRALNTLSKHSTRWATSLAHFCFLRQESSYITQVDLKLTKLTTLLLWPPVCWDYRLDHHELLFMKHLLFTWLLHSHNSLLITVPYRCVNEAPDHLGPITEKQVLETKGSLLRMVDRSNLKGATASWLALKVTPIPQQTTNLWKQQDRPSPECPSSLESQ